jgi:predicted NAD/FAD-binding protein
MLRDLRRFYRDAPGHLPDLERSPVTLGAYLCRHGYGRAFREDHLLPMASAIWSAPAQAMLDYPAASFIRFFDNHGLLRLQDRPQWRTVTGSSRAYVARLSRGFADRVRLGAEVVAVTRTDGNALVRDSAGHVAAFDHVVIATHADQALRLLGDADASERKLLGAFRYTQNTAVLHSDPALMPKRRAAWSSWNYLQRNGQPCVSYWMNRLQGLDAQRPLIVTLNPDPEPDPALVIHRQVFEHPHFDLGAMEAQRRLWYLQGNRNTWFCGAYFGAGFHEDGLQAGLAVAEQLGGIPRPWIVPAPSSRIVLGAAPTPRPQPALAS